MTVSRVEAQKIINDLFEEEALVIGGLVAVHDLDDDMVWRLVKNLDAIRLRFLKRFECDEEYESESPLSKRSKLNPHPAIEDFLANIRRNGL